MLKICFIAPSCYGKSTAIEILKKHYKLVNIKIAKPIYDLQNYFYKFINAELKVEQDGELLQFLGVKIRKENSRFLLDNFKKELKCLEMQEIIVTNDDCRPPDYDELKKLGFAFVQICGFKRTRNDHTSANEKSSLEWQSNIVCDYIVENMGTLQTYEENLLFLIDKIKKGL